MASAARSARLPTISEWWYVPGVSTSRRRSSGWDGLASSSSWNTVRIPNTEPSTANVPTAATDEPAADAAEANHSSRTPADVARAEQREDRHDQRVDDEHGDRRLDEDLQPIALADGDDAGQPAEEDVGRELERRAVRRAPPTIATMAHDDRRDGGVEQDRQQHRRWPRSAGSTAAQPAGGHLERERRADEQQADEHQHVVAVPERRPEPPDPGQQHPDRSGPRAGTSRPKLATSSGASSPSPSASIDSRSAAVSGVAVADDDLALEDLDADRLDVRGRAVARLVGQRLAERRVRRRPAAG